MHTVSCTNTHHYVTELVNHRMLINAKTWVSQEQNNFSMKQNNS